MTNEEKAQRIKNLTISIIEHFETLLPENEYTAAEFYIACEYAKKITAKVLGEDAVDFINKNFWIIDPKDYYNA